VSNDAGDSSSRLSDALDAVFSGHRQPDAEASSNGGSGSVDELADIVPATEESGSVDELPDIVPATEESGSVDELPDIVPATEEPELPRLPRSAPVAPAPSPPAPAPSPPAPAPASPSASRPSAGAPAAPPATAWGDHMPATAAPVASQLRTPGRRPRVRRVTRVLRHIDPWSTFKIALLFSVVAYVVGLTSGVLLWRVADSTGTLDNIERWFTQFGWETFELKGGEIFHNAWIIGLFGVVAATGAAVLLVTLFNLVSDIVGGIRMTVLEEEVVERTISSTRRYVVRTPSSDVTSPTGVPAPAWSVDDADDVADADAGGADDAAVPPFTTAVPDSTGTEPTREQPATSWSVD